MKKTKKPCDGEYCRGSLQYIWKREGRKGFCKRCWSAHTGINNTKPTVKRKPIRPRSSKKIKEDAEYSKLRKEYLASNPFCKAKLPGKCTLTATEVHHKQGRNGQLYLDVSKWLSICHNCHVWLTEHSKEAIEMGLSLPRNHA